MSGIINLLLEILDSVSLGFLSFDFDEDPKIWAFKDDLATPWTKVVSSKKPKASLTGNVTGPFRSEVDCEEFCDHQNVGSVHKKYIQESRNDSGREQKSKTS